MLAPVRTRTRAVTPHLQRLAAQRVHSRQSLGCLPRCSFRQISSSRVWKSSPGHQGGTPAAACVIYSPRVWVMVASPYLNNVQATKGHRTPQKHPIGEQTTDTAGYRSIGRISTVSKIPPRFSLGARGLTLCSADILTNNTPPSRSLLKTSPTCPAESRFGHPVRRADPTA